MEARNLNEAAREAKGEAIRLRDFALQRQEEAIVRARQLCTELSGPHPNPATMHHEAAKFGGNSHSGDRGREAVSTSPSPMNVGWSPHGSGEQIPVPQPHGSSASAQPSTPIPQQAGQSGDNTSVDLRNGVNGTRQSVETRSVQDQAEEGSASPSDQRFGDGRLQRPSSFSASSSIGVPGRGKLQLASFGGSFPNYDRGISGPVAEEEAEGAVKVEGEGTEELTRNGSKSNGLKKLRHTFSKRVKGAPSEAKVHKLNEMGEIVDKKGHRAWDMACALQLGIRVNVGMNSQSSCSKVPDFDTFQEHVKLKFPSGDTITLRIAEGGVGSHHHTTERHSSSKITHPPSSAIFAMPSLSTPVPPPPPPIPQHLFLPP